LYELKLVNPKQYTIRHGNGGYMDASEIEINDLNRWLIKSIAIQWDYKNIVKRKGKLEKLF
jgi:hypothetical protein